MRAILLLSLVTGLALALGGCQSLSDRESVAATSSDWLARTGEAISAQGERLGELFSGRDGDGEAQAAARAEERRALFDQPWIDPLTRYLETHGNDPDYADVLPEIARERERRCAAIGAEYAQREATRETLARLRRGYLYSCPGEVNDFHARVREREAQRATRRSAAVAAQEPPGAPAEAAPEQPDADLEEALDRRQANDCYVFFTIRNFRQAREACLAPAKRGDPRAQRHLGSLAELDGDREAALRWYRKAVAGGDAQAGERLEALDTASGEEATGADR
ncbi:hypothetical protein SAMN04487957_11162 [Halomonas shengliensis]|uniref:Sel1 repeat-containing protein n=1 Tax=Halomonas shengliensis TaxID=419597 RepID=A0A1H0M7Q0_9GAMM|nr:hypothetical protein [Halomonas shengliensis]SDO76434.1 hypothetical protein SAMN04487957_11162 [Halomonas shengliensis]